MQFTANFRSQHDDAIAMADRIGAMAEALGGDADGRLGDEIAERLGQLTRVLRVHFAQEDQLLYPRLMASTDSITAATARSFFEEMGGLGPVYDAFSARWTTPGAIAADPDGFRAASATVFAALAARIAHENAELYPLADWALGEDAEAA